MAETDELSEVIASIYDAALDSRVWKEALTQIQTFVGGCAANFYWQDMSRKSADVYHCVGIDESYLNSYFKIYMRYNPLYPAAAHFPPGEAFGAEAVIPASELRQTRFYKEWMRPQGMVDTLVVNLEKSTTSVAALAVIRGARDGLVDETAKRRLQLLAPHLLRAAAIGRVLQDHAGKTDALIDVLNRVSAGVWLIGSAGRVMFANEFAQTLTEAGRMLRLTAGTLVASEPAANSSLQRALTALGRSSREEVSGAAILLSTEPETRWWAHVLPFSSEKNRTAAAPYCAAGAVVVRRASLDIAFPLETVVRLYKLTGSEARVLHTIVESGGVPAISAALGISQSTVRSHLKSLFAKTGIHRQADLVKLLAAHASPFT